ncbi:MAG: hypothetical protein KF703_13570, partial [Actinobacteria bacterium]|nr:hypothetical protein [Actinomycetota bacterium]
GSAAWQWRQRCGDPHTIGTPGNRPTGPVIQLNLVQCPDDADAGPNEPFLAVVGRAYPRAAPGTLLTLSSDPDTGALELTGEAPAKPDPDGPLVVWVPDRVPALGDITSESLAGITVAEVDGGSVVTATATGGRYRLALSPR